MTTMQEFRCEVCGLVTTTPIHWFVIRCRDSDLTVYRWNSETANAAGARHYCGEAHAEVYISRWFESGGGRHKARFKYQAAPSRATARNDGKLPHVSWRVRVRLVTVSAMGMALPPS